MILQTIRMKMLIMMKLVHMKILLMLKREVKIKNSQKSLYLMQKKPKLIMLKNKKITHSNKFSNNHFNNQKFNRINKLFKNLRVYLILI